MRIFIDNGHGIDTVGKCSPDGKLREAVFNREIARRIVLDLQDRGLDAVLLVPEIEDISLKERCRRVNIWCMEHGRENAILVSIHVNAYGNGEEWTHPRGWSIYTSSITLWRMVFTTYTFAGTVSMRSVSSVPISTYSSLREPSSEVVPSGYMLISSTGSLVLIPADSRPPIPVILGHLS